jgi:uncharacterized protein DUF3313
MATIVVPLSLALAIAFPGTPESCAAAAQPAQAQKIESDAPAAKSTAKQTAKKELSRYQKVMLLPAQLGSGEDAEFEGVPVPGRLAMAVYLTESVADVLKEKRMLAKRPGPDVARLSLVVNDLELTGKGASAAPSLPPFPMAPDLPSEAPGKNGCTGTASVTAKFTDSETGETVASFTTRKTAKGSLLDALPNAIDKVAQAVGNRLEQEADAQRGKAVAE